MSQEVLMSIIINLCGPISRQNPSDKIKLCYEYYVNCAVGANGRIMEFNDFVAACNFDTANCDTDGFCKKGKK